MTPFIFVVKVAIPTQAETVYRDFVFVNRAEAETFRTHLVPYKAHVTQISGYVPSNASTALRRVADITKEAHG